MAILRSSPFFLKAPLRGKWRAARWLACRVPVELVSPSPTSGQTRTRMLRAALLLALLPRASAAFARLPLHRPAAASARPVPPLPWEHSSSRSALVSALRLPPRSSSTQRRARAAPSIVAGMATEDLIPVVFAVLLTGAAGFLQYSLSAGEKGISAFLSKEKADNPFYNYKKTSRSSRSGEPRLSAEEGEKEWKPIPLFSPENAGPFAILLVTFVFLGLSSLPRETLPPLVQQLIPLVLGRQYAVPPTS